MQLFFYPAHNWRAGGCILWFSLQCLVPSLFVIFSFLHTFHTVSDPQTFNIKIRRCAVRQQPAPHVIPTQQQWHSPIIIPQALTSPISFLSATPPPDSFTAAPSLADPAVLLRCLGPSVILLDGRFYFVLNVFFMHLVLPVRLECLECLSASVFLVRLPCAYRKRAPLIW